jgi:hypothetical protein
MRIQKMLHIMGRILFYVFFVLFLVLVIFALARELWWASFFVLVLLVITIYHGLIRLRIHANSVVVSAGKVVFFVPESTVRNRFDFVSRGQSIVELPDYGLLDRPYKVEIFFPDSESRVYACRLSLRFGYLMKPTAWQYAYDKFVEYQEGLPSVVRRQLMKSCERIALQPFAREGEEPKREYLNPVVSELNGELESFGLEIVEVTCSFTEGSSLVRFVAAEQDLLEKGLTESVFRWRVMEEEEPQKGRWALLGVSGKNEL